MSERRKGRTPLHGAAELRDAVAGKRPRDSDRLRAAAQTLLDFAVDEGNDYSVRLTDIKALRAALATGGTEP